MWMEGLERNVVMAEDLLVAPDAVQQVSFREPAAPLTRGQGGLTLDLVEDTVCAGELAVALDLTLLTGQACQHTLRSGVVAPLGCGGAGAVVVVGCDGVHGIVFSRGWARLPRPVCSRVFRSGL